MKIQSPLLRYKSARYFFYTDDKIRHMSKRITPKRLRRNCKRMRRPPFTRIRFERSFTLNDISKSRQRCECEEQFHLPRTASAAANTARTATPAVSATLRQLSNSGERCTISPPRRPSFTVTSP